MPFKSKAQKAFLFAKHPDIAKEFAEKTPQSAYKNMPEHVSRDKNRLKEYIKKHGRQKNAR